MVCYSNSHSHRKPCGIRRRLGKDQQPVVQVCLASNACLINRDMSPHQPLVLATRVSHMGSDQSIITLTNTMTNLLATCLLPAERLPSAVEHSFRFPSVCKRASLPSNVMAGTPTYITDRGMGDTVYLSPDDRQQGLEGARV